MKYDNDIEKYINKLSAPNIGIIGLTGVGKSSLINTIFGTEIATTGAGKAVTTEYTKYSPSASSGIDLPVNLYDSPGYEPGDKIQNFVEKTKKFLNEKNRLGEKEQIHLIWYLINASTARLTPADIEILAKINQNNIPAIIVLSKSDIGGTTQKEELKRAIEETKFSKVYKIVEVAAKPLTFPNGKYIYEPFGMEKLVAFTKELLPKIYLDGFIVSQIVDIESKKELAWKHVRTASFACFGIGSAPIPGSAPTSLIAGLIYMYSRIIAIYGHTNIGLFLAISGITLGGVITVVTDGWLDLFSWAFPGISILTGGAAAGFTAASGIAFIDTCEELAIEELTGSESEIKQKIRKKYQEKFRNASRLNIVISTPQDIDRVGTDFINKKI